MRWYKIDRNFACFWPLIFLGGEPPEFLDLHYKIEPDSYRAAKIDGDRPRELGDLALKKKKELDGQGRARREAARRRKSECKVNLDILNSSRSSASKRLQKLYPRTRVVWTCVSLQRTSTSGVSICAQ